MIALQSIMRIFKCPTRIFPPFWEDKKVHEAVTKKNIKKNKFQGKTDMHMAWFRAQSKLDGA
jgi:hypothetical protein